MLIFYSDGSPESNWSYPWHLGWYRILLTLCCRFDQLRQETGK